MRILEDTEIQKAINNCNPSKIAVAYIGADWKDFITGADLLDAVIVSPTFGSNPWAITDLIKHIGWERTYFLDELHAKAYIGNKAAVIGSANLTRNGLSGEGLVELCVLVDEVNTIDKIHKTFADLKDLARSQYPTKKSKQLRLKELERIWGAAVAHRILQRENRNISSLSEFEPLGEDHFYVLWYQPIKCEYSDDIKAIQSLVIDEIHFASGDEVKRNKWALVWRITNSYAPHKSATPYWLYIHEVFENGVINEGYEYPQCAVQRRDMEVPYPPFEITPDVAAAFKKAINDKDIAEYLIQNDKDIFSLTQSFKGMPLLIERMQKYLTNNPALVDKK